MKVAVTIFHVALIFYGVLLVAGRWGMGNRKLFWGALFVHLTAGIAVGLVYTYYYSANDTWLFFEEAGRFSTIAHQDFLLYLKALLGMGEVQNWPGLIHHDWRTILFIKIISIFWLLSLGNYWVCAAYVSFFSFVCAWRFHYEMTATFRNSATASALAFLFFPSVVFWSSGLEKESFSLCGIYFLSILFLKLVNGERVPAFYWLTLFPVWFLVWTLKYYWVGIFLIAAFAALLLRFLYLRVPVRGMYLTMIWFILFFGVGILLTFTHPNFYLSRFLEVIVSNHNEFVAISRPNNLIHYFRLHKSWANMLINAPWALFSGLFRPLPGEGQGILGLAASAENFMLLLLFVSSLVNLKRPQMVGNQIMLLSVISYCMAMCIFLALSTPNFGTLSRYRVGFLPFFVFLLAYRNPLVDWMASRMKNKGVS